jgi:class 3 adenylate cyclase
MRTRKRTPLIATLLALLHPPFQIYRASWLKEWNEREKRPFVRGAYAFFALFTVVYVYHYYLIDVPLKKTPIELWAKYRFGLAALSVSCAAATWIFRNASGWMLKAPLFIAGFMFSYWRAQSMTWREQIPYSYAIFIPVISAIALRSSMAMSMLFLLVCYGFEYAAWASRAAELPYTLSAASVGLIFTAVLRSRQQTEIKAFLSELEKLEAQRLLIQAQEEMSDQLRSFLPSEIYRRAETLMKKEKKTVLEAVDEVLRPKRRLVAVIQSDIRGSTKKTQQVPEYVLKSVIPMQNIFSDLVEGYGGIPRVVGDQVYAFFDSPDPMRNIVNAARCAFDLVQSVTKFNDVVSIEHKVSRHVIMSFGAAYTGNLGGSNGSRDISVLGDCANLPSRIEEHVKKGSNAAFAPTAGVFISREAKDLICTIYPKVEITTVLVDSPSGHLRDFAAENEINILRTSRVNQTSLGSLFDRNAADAFIAARYGSFDSGDIDTDTEKRIEPGDQRRAA